MEAYDALIEIEDLLLERLRAGEVDGHDIGSGEMNIFVFTDDPSTAFKEIKQTLQDHELWPNVRIGFREVNGSSYTVVHPEGLTELQVE